jgi:hypothetical protein
MGRIKLFYRINLTREKNLLEEFRDLYDGVVLNAHLAAYYSNWTPAFLTQLNKPYFIDPVTYVFARPLATIKSNEDLKKSYEKLRRAYGGRLEKITDTRPLFPKDFRRTRLSSELAKSVLSFQNNLVADQSQTSLGDYLKILGKKEGVKGPTFLVAPYFYFTSLDDPWYEISLKTAKASLKYKGDSQLYAVICAPKSILLAEDTPEKLPRDYKGFDGYLVLVSDFRERDDTENHLRGLIKLIKNLADLEKPVYMLYGGYFSLVLSNYGLTGYSRSLCYGESKKIEVDEPVTVARQPKNYYFDLTHVKLPETVARVFYSDYPKLLCRCNICSGISSKMKSKIEEFFNSIDFDREAKGHFLHVHHSEIQEISKLTPEKIVEKLRWEYETAQDLSTDLYNIPTDHLRKWINVLDTRV